MTYKINLIVFEADLPLLKRIVARLENNGASVKVSLDYWDILNEALISEG